MVPRSMLRRRGCWQEKSLGLNVWGGAAPLPLRGGRGLPWGLRGRGWGWVWPCDGGCGALDFARRRKRGTHPRPLPFVRWRLAEEAAGREGSWSVGRRWWWTPGRGPWRRAFGFAQSLLRMSGGIGAAHPEVPVSRVPAKVLPLAGFRVEPASRRTDPGRQPSEHAAGRERSWLAGRWWWAPLPLRDGWGLP